MLLWFSFCAEVVEVSLTPNVRRLIHHDIQGYYITALQVSILIHHDIQGYYITALQVSCLVLYYYGSKLYASMLTQGGGGEGFVRIPIFSPGNRHWGSCQFRPPLCLTYCSTPLLSVGKMGFGIVLFWHLVFVSNLHPYLTHYLHQYHPTISHPCYTPIHSYFSPHTHTPHPYLHPSPIPIPLTPHPDPGTSQNR